MNKELSAYLKLQVRSLPFTDVVSGMVQTVENVSFTDEEPPKSVVYKYPVGYDVLGPNNCETGPEKMLVPDSSKKSILYFEDYGTTPGEVKKDYSEYTSRVRLVMWLNRKRLVGDSYAEISAYCITKLIGRLCNQPYRNLGLFSRLTITPASIPAQDANIFTRYNYDEKVRQYLRPPFEFFAIDLVCKYRIAANCVTKVDFTQTDPC